MKSPLYWRGLGVLYLSLILLTQLSAQSTWLVDHPQDLINGSFQVVSPQSSNLFYTFGYDQMFFDPNEGHLVKENDLPPFIFSKESVGIYSAPHRHQDILFLDEMTGIMVHRNQILKTTNGGGHWKEVLQLSPNTNYTSSPYFTAVDFPTAQIGYAVGTADKIFKTTDAGESWQELQWSNAVTPYRRLSDVSFQDDENGFALGYQVDNIELNIGVYTPLLYRTTDGGLSWDEQLLTESDHHYFDLYQTGTDTLYISAVNRNYIFPTDQLLRSTDRGQSWTSLILPGLTTQTGLVLRGVHWFSAQEGVVLGSTEFSGNEYHLYKTWDAGTTWLKIALPQGIAPAFTKIPNLNLAFSQDEGVIVGATGQVLHSKDRGESWTTIQQGLPDIRQFSSSNTGLLAVTAGDLFLQKNGTTWASIHTPDQPSGYDKGFDKLATSGTGKRALIDIYDNLYTSTDAGSSWRAFFTDIDSIALDIKYVGDQLNVLARIIDGRLMLLQEKVAGTWEGHYITDNISVPTNSDLQFVGNDTVFAKIDNRLFVSINGGTQWSPVQGLPAEAIIQSFTINEEGWAMMQSSGDHLYISKDAGLSRSETYLPDGTATDLKSASLRAFGRLSADHHYLIFHATTDPDQDRFKTFLFTSTDGGQNWDWQPMPFNKEPLDYGLSAAFVEEGSLYLGSSNGTILRFIPENIVGLPVLENDPSVTVFPNPFHSEIQVSGWEGPMVYQLFHINGQLVQTGQSSDSTPIRLQPNLPSGPYLLSIQNSSRMQTIKIQKRD